MWNFASEIVCGCFQNDNPIQRLIDEVNELNIRKYGELSFVGAAVSTQHRLKQQKSGINADAWLVSWNLLGVADGVSSVESEGYDPSQLPQELLRNCIELCNLRESNRMRFDSASEAIFREHEIPYISYEFLKQIVSRSCCNCTSYGSTTCLLCFLDGNQLWITNVGDSQLIILRPSNYHTCELPKIPDISDSSIRKPLTGNSRCRLPNNVIIGGYQIVARSEVQQHFFNCPYQLTIMPDLDCSSEEILKRSANSIQSLRVDVNVGDMIIMGTDGIFDNIFDEDMIDIANRAEKNYSNIYYHNPILLADIIARELVNFALKAADPVAPGCKAKVTPFSEGALIDVNRHIEGGKPDDITVIVAFVHSNNSTNKTSTEPAIHRMNDYIGSSTKFNDDPSVYIINGQKFSSSCFKEPFSILDDFFTKSHSEDTGNTCSNEANNVNHLQSHTLKLETQNYTGLNIESCDNPVPHLEVKINGRKSFKLFQHLKKKI
ncbi:hypothetical protein cand_034690 [Cryptosporidium andersoni]|uniref:Protein phosphatase n=1 Tax=Cryptosporidium andersoni TaxID=117008 RepID=A0A1J4MYT4_9CRYT|nr:hypothetical protein cand_034690 [Cryptosporidium andersoni]